MATTHSDFIRQSSAESRVQARRDWAYVLISCFGLLIVFLNYEVPFWLLCGPVISSYDDPAACSLMESGFYWGAVLLLFVLIVFGALKPKSRSLLYLYTLLFSFGSLLSYFGP
jgi:hypothetical protein